MNIIKELFYGTLCGEAISIRKGGECSRVDKKIYRFMEKLAEVINKDMFEELDALICENNSVIAAAYFELGFKWGTQLMLAAISSIGTDEFNIN